MASDSYVVTLWHDRERLGAGFLLNRRFALTAAHCLRHIAAQVKRIDLLVGQQRVAAHIEEVASDGDVALIRITGDLPDTGVALPVAGSCRAKDSWFSPFRSSNADPFLDGTVVAESARYQTVAGGTVEALQLECRQHIGDYHGYSGGPIEKRFENSADLVGILIEQYLDSESPTRAANVLFAATIRDACRRFDHLNVAHLAAALVGRDPNPLIGEELPELDHESSLVERQRELIAAGELRLHAIRRWAADGLIEPNEVPVLRSRVARRVLFSKIGRGDRGR